LDSPVVEQVKEQVKPLPRMAARKAARGAQALINGFSFDPHPKRTKFILIAKAAGITAVIMSFIFGRKRRS